MIGTLRAVVLDAPDARRLAAFYTALGGWTEQDADDEWVTVDTGDGWRVAFQRSTACSPGLTLVSAPPPRPPVAACKSILWGIVLVSGLTSVSSM